MTKYCGNCSTEFEVQEPDYVEVSECKRHLILGTGLNVTVNTLTGKQCTDCPECHITEEL